jgi:predicted HicB family RNase H-like nuclease
MQATRDDQRFTLRLDDDLRQELAAEARRQMRSLNNEIQFRLRQSLAGAGSAEHASAA